MDTMKIEQVIVGNHEVSSASVEIKPEPAVVPLQPSKLTSTFLDSHMSEGHLSVKVETEKF